MTDDYIRGVMDKSAEYGVSAEDIIVKLAAGFGFASTPRVKKLLQAGAALARDGKWRITEPSWTIQGDKLMNRLLCRLEAIKGHISSNPAGLTGSNANDVVQLAEATRGHIAGLRKILES